jgi:hypothetical protein
MWVLDKIGNSLPTKMRGLWHKGIYRFFYFILPPGMIKHSVLCQQRYGHLELVATSKEAIQKVRDRAQDVYGDRWGRYSDALRDEVVFTFEKCIVELRAHVDRIDYLEIGSSQGLSMGVIGACLQNMKALGTLISIDPYFEDGYEEGGTHVLINKESRNGALILYESLELDVRLIEKTSYEGLRQLLNEKGKFHLIYIDAFHSGLNPTIDFCLAYQLLHEDGIIMLDDHVWPDVASIKRLCDRHCEKVTECWKIAAYKLHFEQS